MNLAFANGLLLILILVEMAVIKFVRSEKLPWKDVIANLNSGHILLWVFRGLEVAVFHLVHKHASLGIAESYSYLSKWIFAFVVWDFCFYWLHRFHHKMGLLWAVHVVHHEGEHFNLSLGIRNSWYSSLTSIPFFIVLAIIGIPVEIFVAVSSIHYFLQFYNHNSLVKNSGWLEYFLVTPAHHSIHHGANTEYMDKNFGGTFIIWDKLFGTFQRKLEDVPIVYGTHDSEHSHDVIEANNRPLMRFFKANVAPSQPKKSDFKVAEWLIGISGVLLFILLLYYIFREETWEVSTQVIFFSIVFLGTIASGNISDGKKWGLILWSLLFIIACPLFVWTYGELNFFLLSVTGLLFLQTCLMWYTKRESEHSQH